MEDLTGKQFGHYQIVAPLGEGGMAAVYKAYQPAMERFVAIKVLPRHMAGSEEFVARFKREARLLAQLQHPHILPVFDYGEAEDHPYIVMPFLQSGTLAELMRKQRLGLTEIRRLVSQIGDALGYAHARGMIHRDVKPSNVLLDERGNCLLTDFGLARMAEGSAKLTTSGAIMGTPAYMSPEQGTGGEVDGRSDLYALGIILYEMLTGRVPYTAETPIAIVFKHIQDPLPSARKYFPELSDELELVLLKSLAKHPNERYQTAEDFVRALQDAIPAGPVSPRPASLPPQTIASPVQTPSGPAAFEPGGMKTTVEPPSAARKATPPPAPTPAPAFQQTITPPVAPVKKSLPIMWIAGGALLVLVLCGALAFFAMRRLNLPTNRPPTPTNTTQALAAPTALPTQTQLPPPTEIPLPTATATLSIPPTLAIPPGVPFVRINGIRIDDQNRYVVDYETFEYTEKLPGQHIHFFFNNVLPEQAGMPGKGPWILYGGPRPFTKYAASQRPANASQMCALVANPDHSVLPNSGNCFPLPDVPSVTIRQVTACLAEPNDRANGVAKFLGGENYPVNGIQNGWLNVQNPEKPGEKCWIPLAASQINGEFSRIPLVDAAGNLQKAKITLWVSYAAGSAEEAGFKTILEHAKRDLRGIQINTEMISFTEFEQRYRDTAPARRPDLYIFPNDNLGNLAREGVIFDISEVSAGLLDQYAPEALEAMRVEGRLYGIPATSKAMLLWYNKSSLPQPPKTVLELRNLMNGGTPVGISFGCYQMFGFYGSFGSKIFNEKWRVAVLQPSAVDTLRFADELYRIAKANKWPTEDQVDNQMLINGQMAAITTGNWSLGELKRGLGDKLGVAALPGGPGGPATPLLGYDGYHISADSQNKDAALMAALYLTSQDSQQTMLKLAGYIPSRVDVRITDPLVSQVVDAINQGKYLRPHAPEFNKYWNFFCDTRAIYDNGMAPIEWWKAAADKSNAKP